MFKLTYSDQAEADLIALFDFLVNSHVALGASYPEAVNQAIDRSQEITKQARILANVPYQGTLWAEAQTGLRWVTKNRAIFYFKPVAEVSELRILAVFYGGQDHHAIMSKRLGLSH